MLTYNKTAQKTPAYGNLPQAGVFQCVSLPSGAHCCACLQSFPQSRRCLESHALRRCLQRLYIYEVMKASQFVQQKSNALQSQLANGKHQQLRGIALYKNMITDFLQGVNGVLPREEGGEGNGGIKRLYVSSGNRRQSHRRRGVSA